MLLTFENGKKTITKQEIVNLVHIPGRGQVVVSGTLVEGIGNHQSDLDVYVICDRLNSFGDIRGCGHSMFHNPDMMHCREDHEFVRRTLDYIPGDPTHLEVEYWTFEEVEKLKEKIEARFRYVAGQADVTSSSPFTSGEEKLFHRCTVGIDLNTGGPLRDQIFTETHREMYNFLTYRCFGSFFWVFKDVLGAMQAQNEFYIVEMTRTYLIRQVVALYTISGVTNPNLRWFPAYLQRMNPRLFGDVTKQALELLFDLPTSTDGRKDYPYRVFPVLDEIAALIRNRLDSSSVMPSCAEALDLLKEEKLARAAGNPLLVKERLFLEEFAFREGVLGGISFSHREFIERNLDWTAGP